MATPGRCCCRRKSSVGASCARCCSRWSSKALWCSSTGYSSVGTTCGRWAGTGAEAHCRHLLDWAVASLTPSRLKPVPLKTVRAHWDFLTRRAPSGTGFSREGAVPVSKDPPHRSLFLILPPRFYSLDASAIRAEECSHPHSPVSRAANPMTPRVHSSFSPFHSHRSHALEPPVIEL